MKEGKMAVNETVMEPFYRFIRRTVKLKMNNPKKRVIFQVFNNNNYGVVIYRYDYIPLNPQNEHNDMCCIGAPFQL